MAKRDLNKVEITIRQGCSPVNLCMLSEHLFIRTTLEGCSLSLFTRI